MKCCKKEKKVYICAVEIQNNKTYLVFVEHLDKWFLANSTLKMTYYQKYIEYYTLLEGQLENCIFSRSELADVKEID